MNNEFYSNGKLLLTGEYAVLDGALSLALPTRYGQSLLVNEINKDRLVWKSLDENGSVWFEGEFDLKNIIENQSLSSNSHSDDDQKETVRKTLLKILAEAKKLNSKFLEGDTGYEVTTKLTFPRNWGLGSSSTLINNIAHWAKVDAFKLLWNAFPGSGYDIACAQNNTPILYKITNQYPDVKPLDFNPPFKNNLYFVYLNKKQNSRNEITKYNSVKKNKTEFVNQISDITCKIIKCNSLEDFEALIDHHEDIIAEYTGQQKVKVNLFSDFTGSIKSLGAWGGDFILATGNESTPDYFKHRGFSVVFPYEHLIL